MICETGKVVAIELPWIWIETFQTSACTSCSAKAGCGTGVLSGIFSGKRHYVKVSAANFADDIALHDNVEISIPDHVMLKSSFWVYLLPLFLMIVGTFAGNSFYSGDTGSILGALAGLASACFILYQYNKIHQHDAGFQPRLERIISHQVQTEIVAIHPSA